MKTNKNFLQLKNCIPGTADSLLKRAVFEGVGDALSALAKTALEKGKELTEKVHGEFEALKDWDKINAKAMFDTDSETVFNNLSADAYPKNPELQKKYAAELRKVIKDKAENDNDYRSLSNLWAYYRSNGAKKVVIENGIIKFKNSEDKEIQIKHTSIPIYFNPSTEKTKKNEPTVHESDTKAMGLFKPEEVKALFDGKLENGDVLKIHRYEGKKNYKDYTVIYKNDNFYYFFGDKNLNGAKANIYKNDKITLIPKKERQEKLPPHDLEIEGKSYELIGKAPKNESARSLAKRIFDGMKQETNLSDEMIAEIKATGISEEKYAELLDQAKKSEAAKDFDFSPIVKPFKIFVAANSEQKQKESAATKAKTAAEQKQEKERVDATHMTNIEENNWKEIKRTVNPSLGLALTNKDAWDDNWPNMVGTEKIKDVLRTYFNELPDGKIRNATFESIYPGSIETFDPQDVVKAFGIDLKGKLEYKFLGIIPIAGKFEYNDLLGLYNKSTGNTRDVLGNIIKGVEALCDAITQLKLEAKKQPSAKKIEYSGDTRIDDSKKPRFLSVSKLDALHQEVPGMPLKEATKIFGKYKVFKEAETIFEKMGVKESARLSDKAENLRSNKTSDFNFNVRYKGRDLTVRLWREHNFTVIELGNGFDNADLKRVNTDWFTFEPDETKAAIDKFLSSGELPQALNDLNAAPNEAGIIIDPKVVQEINSKMIYSGGGARQKIELNSAQVMELIARLYSIKELKDSIQKVVGQNNYIITKLPVGLDKQNLDLSVIQLAYVIKYKGKINDETASLAESVQDKAQDKLDDQKRLARVINTVFPPNAGDVTKRGKKMGMTEITAGESRSDLRDIYYIGLDGQAANDMFDTSARKRSPEGKLEEKNVIAEFQKLYKKGLQFLAAKSNQPGIGQYYRDLAKGLEKGKSITITNLEKIGAWEIEIIRLGLVQDQMEKESNQEAIIREQIIKLAPELAEQAKKQGFNFTKEEIAARLKQFPVSILLTTGLKVDTSTGKAVGGSVGGYAPIMLGSIGDFDFVVAPGGQKDIGSKSGSLSLQFGAGYHGDLSHTVTFFGGVSAGPGLGLSEGGPAFLPSAVGSAGLKYKVAEAGEKRDYDHYIGHEAGAGAAYAGGVVPILNVAPIFYEWKLDAQNKYNKELQKTLEDKKVADFMKELGEAGTDETKLDTLAIKIKNSPELQGKLSLPANPKTQDIITAFGDYIAQIIEDFTDNFDLPLITGGKIEPNAALGTITIVGAGTGNVPLAMVSAGAFVADLTVGFLASLNINVRKKITMVRSQTTSDETMDTAAEISRTKQIDEAFANIKKSFPPEVQKKIEELQKQTSIIGGKQNLDTQGKIYTSEASGKLQDVILGLGIAEYNKMLKDKGIQLIEQTDHKIKVEFTDLLNKDNVTVYVGEGIASLNGNEIYIQDPAELSSLYVNKYTRQYPFQTRHGASRETVIMLSNNAYYSAQELPKAFTLTKFRDENEWNITDNRAQDKQNNAEPKAYEKPSLAEIDKEYNIMREALNTQYETLDSKTVKQYADGIGYETFKNNKGETFHSITNRDAQESINKPDYTKERLFKFFDDYADSQKPPVRKLNGKEKEALLVQLSIKRYIILARNPKAFEDEQRWVEEHVLRPVFFQRIKELRAKGVKIGKPEQSSEILAVELASQAVEDVLKNITPEQLETPDQLDDSTTAAVAIGRGGNGLHHLLNALIDKETEQKSPYGYVIARDYTKALKDESDDRHDLALVLLEEMASVPDANHLEELKTMPLARSLASIEALALIVGMDNYKEIVNFYKEGKIPNPPNGLYMFRDIIAKVREAEKSNQWATVVEGINGKKYTIKMRAYLRAGVFSECANYSPLFKEEVSIMPTAEIKQLLATEQEGNTTVKGKRLATFTGLGLSANHSVALGTVPTLPTPETPPGKPPKLVIPIINKPLPKPGTGLHGSKDGEIRPADTGNGSGAGLG